MGHDVDHVRIHIRLSLIFANSLYMFQNQEKQLKIKLAHNFCNTEKERRMNSDSDFDENSFEKAKDLALAKLLILKENGWV